MLKKFFLVGLFVFSLAFVSTAQASVNIAEELQSQINAILAQIKSLQAQIASQPSVSTGGSTSTGSSSGGGSVSTSPAVGFCYNFTRNLSVGSSLREAEADAIGTIFLKEGFLDSNNVNFFDEDLAAAVVQFQSKYGIRQTGTIGPITRAKLNALYKCSSKQDTITTPVFCTADVMQCSDGSYVSRIAPSCKFPSCSGEIGSSPAIPKPSITLLSLKGDERWPIGSKQTVKVRVTRGFPSNAGIYFFINRGKVAGFPLNYDSDGIDFEITIPSSVVVGGDMVTMLNPGSYYLEAAVYNSYPACLGYCANGAPDTKVLAKDSSYRKIIIEQTGTAKNYVTVASPNGGESWASGSMQTIKWKDSTPVPKCPTEAKCINPAPKFYDIRLESTSRRPCSENICADVLDTYTIAKNVADTFYQWSVGKIIDINEALIDGAYTIQVCQSGTSTCDSSDSYFKITPSEQITQQAVQTSATAVINSVIRESVKCIFEGSTSSQTCYSTNQAGMMFIFNGTETAGGTVSGTKNENLTWKSSCGGYAYTTITGNNKYAKFSCKPYSI